MTTRPYSVFICRAWLMNNDGHRAHQELRPSMLGDLSGKPAAASKGVAFLSWTELWHSAILCTTDFRALQEHITRWTTLWRCQYISEVALQITPNKSSPQDHAQALSISLSASRGTECSPKSWNVSSFGLFLWWNCVLNQWQKSYGWLRLGQSSRSFGLFLVATIKIVKQGGRVEAILYIACCPGTYYKCRRWMESHLLTH